MEERQSEDSPCRRSVPIPDALRKISGIVSLPKGQTEEDIIAEAILGGAEDGRFV